MAYHRAQVKVVAQVPLPEASDEDGAFILEYKPSKIKGQSKGREQGPKTFGKDERTGFQRVEAENWAKHLEHGAVRVVLPDEARDVPKAASCLPPSRFVYTMQGDAPNARFVVPGHTDPDKDKSVDEGGVRTDSPVAPQAAVHAALATAALHR